MGGDNRTPTTLYVYVYFYILSYYPLVEVVILVGFVIESFQKAYSDQS